MNVGFDFWTWVEFGPLKKPFDHPCLHRPPPLSWDNPIVMYYSVVGVPAVAHHLSAISDLLSAISYQLSTISYLHTRM